MMVDSSCKVQRINLAIRPIHEKEPWATTTSFARVMTEDRAGLGPSAAPTTVDRAAETAVVVAFRDSIFFDNEAQTGRLAGAHVGRVAAAERMARTRWRGKTPHRCK